ncbi:MAG: GUN4 domain-containing protein [Cyanobacteria bacterium P01_E01_bin.6]
MSQQPSQKPALEERLTDAVFKIITAGSGGYALYNLFSEDIPKAAIAGMISFGSALVTSFGQGLTETLKASMKKRGQTSGKAIDGGIDQVLTYLMDKATGGTPEDRYLACQALDCQAVESEGAIQYDGIFTPLLAEVFVSLSIDSIAVAAGFNELSREGIKDDLNIWDFLEKSQKIPIFRQLAVLAWGGSGKTTMLKHIAYCYGSKQVPQSAPRRIPFLLILRKYRDTLTQENPPNLPTLITEHHIPSLPVASDLQMPSDWAHHVLMQGRAIVMLDGFDEVPIAKRSQVARWIKKHIRQYSKSIFILTSRPKAYIEQNRKVQDPEGRIELATRLWVQDFNADQRKEFVEKWYLCQTRYAHGGRNTPDVHHKAAQAATNLLNQIELRDELKALAKNPLLLNMIVTFHRRNPGTQLPQRRVELYKEICQLQLKDRPGDRQLDTLLTQCDAQTILQQIALGMMKQRWERIQRKALLNELKKILEQNGETIDADEFLKQVVQISELVIRQEDEYEFAHLSFQEYLASTHINQTRQERLLYDYFDDDKWKPTILLYVAQTTNPTTLIQEMVKRGATDLAYQCLQELPKTKQIDSDLEAQITALKQSVTTSRYAQLEAHLRNGQWKAADHETYRLMITTVGKEEGQWFTSKELLSFPCEELLAIDGLWVKYSNGKFGFSVQKDIYLECGGIPDGQYHEEAWDKFCHTNEWKKDGKYVNVKFDTSSPRGHLPVEYLLEYLRGWRDLSLLSHPDL